MATSPVFFNVRTYGATGDGTTDDRAAVNAAVVAANAAGGGTVYFPPGTYAITRPGLTSIDIANVHNVTFLGDGKCSTILMSGSASAATWYLFRIHDGSSRIRFDNLNFSGTAITSPSLSQQNHYLQIEGVAADTHGAPSDIDVAGCWFDAAPGACVRVLGIAAAASIPNNIRVNYCAADLDGNRSFAEAQRDSQKIAIHHNWITGVSDQDIDFEPSAGSGAGLDGPSYWSIIGNHIARKVPSTGISLTLSSGELDQGKQNVLAYNTISHGGTIQATSTLAMLVLGNIMVVDSASAPGPLLQFIRIVENAQIVSNVFCETTRNDVAGIAITSSDGTSPLHCAIRDNVVTIMSTGGTTALVTDGTHVSVIDGNIAIVDTTTATVSIFAHVSVSAIANTDHCSVVGNLAIATNGQFQRGVNLSAAGGVFDNSVIAYNLIDHTSNATQMDNTGGTYTGWSSTGCNNFPNAATSSVNNPGTQGVVIEGNAGPGPQVTLCATGAGPNTGTSAPAGSVAVNTSGAAATSLWYKESGAGNTGWQPTGDSEIVFATQSAGSLTTNLYMAPSMDQVTASATEFQVRCPRAGTLRTLRVRCVAGVGAGNVTYRVRVNGSNSSVVYTAANTGTGGLGTGTAVVAAGDLLSVTITKTGVPTTPQTFVTATFGITG